MAWGVAMPVAEEENCMTAKHLRSWLCALAFAVAPGVEAATHFYQLQGVVFDDGTQATGAFVYDDVANAVVGWNIEVRGNGTLLPFAYMPGDSVAGFDIGPPTPMLVFSSVEAGSPHPGGVSERQLRITPTLPLGGAATHIPLDLATWGGGSGGVECLNCGAPRYIVAGALLETSSPALAFLGEAVEFYHAGFDHYFLTANGDEIFALDTGYFAGWARTGETIRVFETGSFNEAPVRPVCRYYGLPSAGLDSHFYSADPAECYRVNRDFGTAWQVESGNVFQISLPDKTTGNCPIAGVPVYRVFNHRADANHRYTTKTAIRAQMEAAGWIREGYGPDAVIMCAMPPPLN
jgi:hypothetical protein